MTSRHWNDEELIARLYGAGPVDRHLEECGECAARWRKLLAERERLVTEEPVSEEFLAAQRQAVYKRLEAGRFRRRWVAVGPPALATAAVVLLGIVLHRPSPVAPRDLSDAELFAESYSLAQSLEPVAVEWMHGLFETEVSQ
jgi:anti-sigma factor RsiW